MAVVRDDALRYGPADLAAAHAVILAQREMLTIARSEVTRWYFFKLAQENKARIVIEAVRRIDELFEIERTINGPNAAAARRGGPSKI